MIKDKFQTLSLNLFLKNKVYSSQLGNLPIFIFFSFLFCGLDLPNKESFYELMGNKEKIWQEVLPEDKHTLETLAHCFQTSHSQKATYTIPKKIHFIWVGPKAFPQSSIKNIVSWAEKHPDFEMHFWSDRERVLPHPSMKLRLVEDFSWIFLKKLFLSSTNYGEQSDLLRYEILYQEGGIYVDHDVECFKPFTSLAETCDLFCGLEPPHKPIAETSITVCNNLIGSCPEHPILKKTIEKVLARWETYQQRYLGEDKDSVTKRVYYRTFSPFDEAVKNLLETTSYKNVVFPAGYFNKINHKFGYYAHHSYASTWFETESSFEKNVRQKLVKICRKNNQIIMISFACFITSFLFIITLLFQIYHLKKQLREVQRKDPYEQAE
jgi:hypothetical protein